MCSWRSQSPWSRAVKLRTGQAGAWSVNLSSLAWPPDGDVPPRVEKYISHCLLPVKVKTFFPVLSQVRSRQWYGKGALGLVTGHKDQLLEFLILTPLRLPSTVSPKYRTSTVTWFRDPEHLTFYCLGMLCNSQVAQRWPHWLQHSWSSNRVHTLCGTGLMASPRPRTARFQPAPPCSLLHSASESRIINMNLSLPQYLILLRQEFLSLEGGRRRQKYCFVTSAVPGGCCISLLQCAVDLASSPWAHSLSKRILMTSLQSSSPFPLSLLFPKNWQWDQTKTLNQCPVIHWYVCC